MYHSPSYYSLDRFNSRYKHVATPTKPAAGDIFNYQERSTSSELNIEEQANDTVPSVASGASIVPLDKSPACSKMDEKKSKLRTVVALSYYTSGSTVRIELI